MSGGLKLGGVPVILNHRMIASGAVVIAYRPHMRVIPCRRRSSAAGVPVGRAAGAGLAIDTCRHGLGERYLSGKDPYVMTEIDLPELGAKLALIEAGSPSFFAHKPEPSCPPYSYSKNFDCGIAVSHWWRLVEIMLIASLFASASALADDLQTCAHASGEKALVVCTRAIESNRFRGRQLAIVYFYRGLAYQGKGDHDRAIADYDQAIKLDPKSTDAFLHRGIAYDNKGQHDRAIADYDQTIKLNPNPKIGSEFLVRGDAYHFKGEHDRAIADYDQGIRLNFKNAYAFWERGSAYGAKGDIDRAIADYDRSIRLDPKNIQAFSDRGYAYESNGQHDRAIADYDQVIKLNPNPKIAFEFLARGDAYHFKGEHDRAIADYDQAIKLSPKESPMLVRRGRAHLQQTNFDLALTDLIEAIRLTPQNPEAHGLRGQVWEAEGDLNRARDDYSAALSGTGIDLEDYQAQEMAGRRLVGIAINVPDPFREVALRTVRLHVTGRSDGVETVNEVGTGFFVDPNYIITAAHVFGEIDWVHSIDGRPNSPTIDMDLPNHNILLVPTSNKASGAILAAQNRALDLALIRVKGNFPSVSCADAHIQRLGGRPFRALGWRPDSSDYDPLTQPSESDVRLAEPADGDPRWRFADINASKGNSGGPIFNKDGAVIAVITSGRNKRLEPGQSVVFGTPIQSIKNGFPGHRLDDCFEVK
jgi:tetratricopeptide (TPR) repeat protein